MSELRIMQTGIILVVGASPEPTRYSFLAATRLLAMGHAALLFGKHAGSIAGEPIRQQIPAITNVHTVTMYVAPRHQAAMMDELLALHPARIIFNPGTENPAFAAAAMRQGIEVVEACTLVMLATGQF